MKRDKILLNLLLLGFLSVAQSVHGEENQRNSFCGLGEIVRNLNEDQTVSAFSYVSAEDCRQKVMSDCTNAYALSNCKNTGERSEPFYFISPDNGFGRGPNQPPTGMTEKVASHWYCTASGKRNETLSDFHYWRSECNAINICMTDIVSGHYAGDIDKNLERVEKLLKLKKCEDSAYGQLLLEMDKVQQRSKKWHICTLYTGSGGGFFGQGEAKPTLMEAKNSAFKDCQKEEKRYCQSVGGRYSGIVCSEAHDNFSPFDLVLNPGKRGYNCSEVDQP